MILKLRHCLSSVFITLLIFGVSAAAGQEGKPTASSNHVGVSERASPGGLKLEPHAITLSSGKKFVLNLPPGFDVPSPAAAAPAP